MTWITPGLGALIALIAVPTLIILYFLKLRRRDLEVSSTFLWKKAIQDLQANAPFQRLRRNLLLFLQLLVLAGICIALAQPQIKSQTIAGNRHVIMIDRSASMSATDEKDKRGDPQSRFRVAVNQATALVDSLREGGILSGRATADEAMVISFDSSAEIRQKFTTDKSSLRSAIESITPTQSPTSVDEAFRLAQAHKPRRVVENLGMQAGPPVTIHLFSDGRIPDALSAKTDPDDTLQFERIGTPEAVNLGIVGLRAAREYDNPAKLSIYVSVQNNQAFPRSVDIELVVDGVSAKIKPATIPAATTDGVSLSAVAAAKAAGADKDVAEVVGNAADSAQVISQKLRPGVGGAVFNLELAQSALVQVHLRAPSLAQPPEGDVLTIDDTGFLVIPAAKKLSVLVVSTQTDSWLDVALSGLPLSRLAKLAPTMFDQWASQGKLGEFDVIILENWVPPASATNPLQGQLPPGSYIIFGGVPAGGQLGLKDIGTTGAAGIVDWSADHPVLRNISLSRLRISEMRSIEADPMLGAVTLAMSDAGPAMVEASANAVHVLAMPFILDKTTWAFDPGFVVFVGAAIRYMGGDAGAGSMSKDAQPGTVISDRLPPGADNIKLKLPSGETQTLVPATDGKITFGPLAASGFYHVTWTGPAGPTDTKAGGDASRSYAANLADTAESDIAAAADVSTAATVAAARGRASVDADRRLWPYLIMIALFLAMVEWFIYNRKVYV